METRRWMSCTAVVMLALVLGPTAAKAQWFQGAGYFAAGASGTKSAALDDHLAAQGYPRFGAGAMAVGIGGYATVAKRFMFGGEWTGLIKAEKQHQGRTLFLGGGYGTLGIGYAIKRSARTRVYPRIGLGGGGLGLTFDSIEDSVPFNNVLADPDAEADLTKPQPTLTRGHGVIDIGLGAEYMPSGTGRGTFIGFRLGVAAATSPGGWHLNHRPVSGGPEGTLTGPYFKVTIGAAAWR
jgi:hypothetical protein